jgi:hypothetical protein
VFKLGLEESPKAKVEEDITCNFFEMIKGQEERMAWELMLLLLI